MSTFVDLVEKRRSIYALGTASRYFKQDIEKRIREVVIKVPSAFNSQITRVVILFDNANIKFWNHIYDVQKMCLKVRCGI